MYEVRPRSKALERLLEEQRGAGAVALWAGDAATEGQTVDDDAICQPELCVLSFGSWFLALRYISSLARCEMRDARCQIIREGGGQTRMVMCSGLVCRAGWSLRVDCEPARCGWMAGQLGGSPGQVKSLLAVLVVNLFAC